MMILFAELSRSNLLTPDCMIMLQHEVIDDVLPAVPPEFARTDYREYGRTALTFLEHSKK